MLISSGWLCDSRCQSSRQILMLALQWTFLAQDDCRSLVIQLPYFFLTSFVHSHIYNVTFLVKALFFFYSVSLSLWHYSFRMKFERLKPLVCFFLSLILINASSSNCGVKKFSEVWKDGTSWLNFWLNMSNLVGELILKDRVKNFKLKSKKK